MLEWAGQEHSSLYIDQALEAVEKEGKVDIPGIIANLRQQRTKMVQTLVCCVSWSLAVSLCVSVAVFAVGLVLVHLCV